MINLSHYLNSQTPAYGGAKDDLEISKNSSICCGDSSNSLKITLKNHIGTHIDFPKHFHDSGKTLNDYPTDFWSFTRPQMLEFPCKEGYLIGIKDLTDKIGDETDLLIIRTGFENFRYEEAYWARNPGFDKEVGHYLRENFPKLRCIGFDFISLTSYLNRPLGREAHKSFLADHKGLEAILIIEDMKLSEVKSPLSQVIIAPLMVDKADGIPVTVFAYE